ncbi:hypothetical protein FSARC_4252 [Fusarium sarcochroum]|uniref:Uncharacterized protein n=1 Tax=Fusarium sarcochroum TaxID=1208366 RepID=A0A8H4U276_9HYPO|nr:hypothetical protein FSARC_4252 [Fusarium sarcochroum]
MKHKYSLGRSHRTSLQLRPPLNCHSSNASSTADQENAGTPGQVDNSEADSSRDRLSCLPFELREEIMNHVIEGEPELVVIPSLHSIFNNQQGAGRIQLERRRLEDLTFGSPSLVAGSNLCLLARSQAPTFSLASSSLQHQLLLSVMASYKNRSGRYDKLKRALGTTRQEAPDLRHALTQGLSATEFDYCWLSYKQSRLTFHKHHRSD